MNIYLKRRSRAALMGSAVITSIGMTSFGPAASAQDQDADVEEIVVTGSRIKRPDLDSVSPLSITSSADIKLSGYTRIEDMMNSLPQIEAGQNAFISNGASGTANIDLRGMGAARTLVLVNGRRLQPGGVYSQAPDINQIPAGLVERAEVLTGGASATYGADAVAGVVNFIMKKDFEGIEITAGMSAYQHNNDNSYIQGLMDDRGFDYPTGSSGLDGTNYNVDMAMGSQFADGKGHATVYATWRKVKELRQEARDYSSCALNNAGTSCGGSGNAIIPNFYIGVPVDFEDPQDPGSGVDIYGQPLGSFNWATYNTAALNPDYNISVDEDDPLYDPFEYIQADAWDYWTLDPSGDGFIGSSGNVYNYAPVNHFQRPDERFTLGAYADYEINEQVHPYMEVSYMRDRTVAQIAESGTFFAETYTLGINNPIIDATQRQMLIDTFGIDPVDGEFITYIGKRNVEGGPRASNIEHNSFRIVTGSEGTISDTWSYNASLQYGSTSSSAAYINDFLSTAVGPAIESGAYPVFGYQEITPEDAAGMTGVGVLTGITKEYIANAYVTGDMGVTIPSANDPVAVVFGVEYRKEVFERVSDTVFEQGLLLGQGGPTVSITGSYDVKEVFAEAEIPLVQGKSMMQDLTLEVAGRVSDYNTSGSAETYKAGVNWTINDYVKLRASYNRAVRAPNVTELFIQQNQGLWNGTDPCGGATPELSAAQCANTGVTAAQYGSISLSPASQYNGLFGGNPDLAPEIADTFTIGAVLSPLAGLKLTVDYWDITINDVIGAVGAELTVRQCALTGNAAFCDNVVRSAGGSLWLGTAGYVQATSINLASRHWQGVDFQGDYDAEFMGGTITAQIKGTLMLKKEYDPLPGADAVYDCKGVVSVDCFPQPKWRHTARLNYASDSFWSVQARWRYFSSLTYPGGPDTLVADGLAAQSYIDLTASFDVNENVGLLVGINNIFDKEPPMTGGTLGSNANTVAGFYDTLGRYLHASVTLSF